MSVAVAWSDPFYSGTVSSSEDRWPLYLGGHGYMLDTSSDEWGWQTVQMIRQQSDSANRPGEESLNPEGLWRRAQEAWHHGAGQEWLDKPDTDPYRFWTSKGVDPWSRWGLSLLPDTRLNSASGSAAQFLTTAQGRLYWLHGTNLSATPVGDITMSGVTMFSSQTGTSITSDGTTVYVGLGTDGIWTNPSVATTFTQYATGNVTLVRYVKGRLIAAIGSSIYNVTGSGAVTAGNLLLTHPNPSWTWTDATEGPGFIYLTGYASDHSAVYRVTIATDGTDLDPAIQAGQLPDGEVARSITGYLGYVAVGTDTGVRFAVPESSGDLTFGPRIPATSPVLCAEGQDRFVWYGLTNYDAVSTGLGRMDLATFTDDLTPAYASDLMATGQGAVTSVTTYLDKRWFTVASTGLYQQDTTLVDEGTLYLGRIGWGLPDRKTAMSAQVAHDPLPSGGSVTLALGGDGDPPTGVGASNTPGTISSSVDTFALNGLQARDFQVLVTLEGDVTLRRVTILADPSADRTVLYSMPILLEDRVAVEPEVDEDVDVAAEFAYLLALCRERRVVTLQEGPYSTRVVLDNFLWRPRTRTRNRDGWQGTFVARLKGLSL